jgi:excisionase family DNA binding protein
MVLNPGSSSRQGTQFALYAQAQAVSGLSRSTLYELIKNGRLRAVKVAGRRLIPRDALEALLLGDGQ